MEDVIKRIKELECPTGDLESRLLGILEDYGVATANEIMIDRNRKLDVNGAEAYNARIANNNDQTITILAKSGSDDYVVKVIDVYAN